MVSIYILSRQSCLTRLVVRTHLFQLAVPPILRIDYRQDWIEGVVGIFGRIDRDRRRGKQTVWHGCRRPYISVYYSVGDLMSLLICELSELYISCCPRFAGRTHCKPDPRPYNQRPLLLQLIRCLSSAHSRFMQDR